MDAFSHFRKTIHHQYFPTSKTDQKEYHRDRPKNHQGVILHIAGLGETQKPAHLFRSQPVPSTIPSSTTFSSNQWQTRPRGRRKHAFDQPTIRLVNVIFIFQKKVNRAGTSGPSFPPKRPSSNRSRPRAGIPRRRPRRKPRPMVQFNTSGMVFAVMEKLGITVKSRPVEPTHANG